MLVAGANGNNTAALKAAAAKASKTVQVPHNVVTKPSVSVSKKTPTAAGTGISASKAKSSANPVAPGAIPVAPSGIIDQPVYDGSTAANPSLYPGDQPVDTTSAASAWQLENDPLYQAAIASGQSAFNTARANAMANLNAQQITANQNLQQLNQTAAGARKNLAGNYAQRGMQGGARGAYYRAQDAANAQQIAAQTSTKDQLAALNQDYLSKFGATGTDWTGTTEGQNYKNQAVQQALTALASKYTQV